MLDGKVYLRNRVEASLLPSTSSLNAWCAWDPIHVDASIGSTPGAEMIPVVHGGSSSLARSPCKGTLALEGFAHRFHGWRTDACILSTTSPTRRVVEQPTCHTALPPCTVRFYCLDAWHRCHHVHPPCGCGSTHGCIQPPWTVPNRGLYGPRLSRTDEAHRSTSGPSSDVPPPPSRRASHAHPHALPHRTCVDRGVFLGRGRAWIVIGASNFLQRRHGGGEGGRGPRGRAGRRGTSQTCARDRASLRTCEICVLTMEKLRCTV